MLYIIQISGTSFALLISSSRFNSTGGAKITPLMVCILPFTQLGFNPTKEVQMTLPEE